MTVAYNHERDQLEIHWSSEPGEWRRARANVDLKVNEANESVGIAISAASWLVPELAGVHTDLYQLLPLASWAPHHPPAPSLLRGLTAKRNVQQQLDWDCGDIPAPEPARRQRGICQHCGAVATDRRRPSITDRWPFESCCIECDEVITAELAARPAPERSANPYTGDRAHSVRNTNHTDNPVRAPFLGTLPTLSTRPCGREPTTNR